MICDLCKSLQGCQEKPAGRLQFRICQYHQRGALKKVISPAGRRQAVEQVVRVLDVSERPACRVLGQPRATPRHEKRQLGDEQILTERIVTLASQYGRYGYRRVMALLRNEGWLARLSVRPLFIEPGSPWENGYIESFNEKMWDEFLAGEIFYSIKEVEVLIEMWRRHYPVPGRCNTVGPHSSLRYRPPAPSAFIAQPSQFQPVGLA